MTTKLYLQASSGFHRMIRLTSLSLFGQLVSLSRTAAKSTLRSDSTSGKPASPLRNSWVVVCCERTRRIALSSHLAMYYIERRAQSSCSLVLSPSLGLVQKSIDGNNPCLTTAISKCYLGKVQVPTLARAALQSFYIRLWHTCAVA